MVKFRRYDHARDQAAVHRIWQEVGWIEDDEKQKAAMDDFVGCARALVAEVRGEAECLALMTSGAMQYLDEELPFAGVTGVTTSRVARKQNLAGRLTAQLLAEEAAAGTLVAGLGMFEQGFYDKLGFGCGPYEHWISFDPAQLRIKQRPRVPQRITQEDWQIVHASRLARWRGHAAVNLTPPELTRGEMAAGKGVFGLGYFDGPDGALTHHLWMSGSDKEHGPYSVWWMSYQTGAHLLELLALLRSFGDQVRQVSLREPPGVQVQDLLQQPFRFRQLTRKSEFENRNQATAYWQARILDLPGCLARTRLPGPSSLRFNLRLSDPIAAYLPDGASWRGVGGEYVVTLGPESSAAPGSEVALPTLEASVNAFTRLWLGACPARGLAITSALAGPATLLEALEARLACLPRPAFDWDF